ncbi:cytochrome-c oxidase, cbb3-type subunit III [Lacibacterium aquatile]|uniref:Cbb3-type cytochrome c oxidase subunit n=1 Tax=Lacibacterium aquatile TaxID=1168082 RepID=A0ABW5DYD4_9PROT
MPTKIEKDLVTGTDTTGHEWDGIKELNTPLPRWWLYSLYATVIWGLVWSVLYPTWPGITGYFSGFIGGTQREEIAVVMANVAAERAPMVKKIAETSIADIRKDPDLAAFAMTGGKQIFGDNCAPCHGPGGGGRVGGFPSLADDDWLWGGSDEAILATIRHGIRNGSAEARDSVMPRFGIDGMLQDKEIAAIADQVLALGKGNAGTAVGAKLYADNCAACHGDSGHGNAELGAPNLVDAVWLYGGSRAQIIQQISAPRLGVMPAWGTRLDPAAVKMLTFYVHSLGGGK